MEDKNELQSPQSPPDPIHTSTPNPDSTEPIPVVPRKTRANLNVERGKGKKQLKADKIKEKATPKPALHKSKDESEHSVTTQDHISNLSKPDPEPEVPRGH